MNRFIFLCLSFCLWSMAMANEATAKGMQGTLAVVNKSDNSVSIVDMETKTIIATLPTGEGPHELVLSDDNKWLVSTDFVGGNSLSVFDVASLSLVHRIALPDTPGPHGIRFLDDNEHVIFTSGSAQKIGRANVRTGKFIDDIATDQATTHMLALNADKSLAYSTNIRANTISVVDLKSMKKLRDIKTDAMPEAVNYRGVNHELWYGANQDGNLVVINADSEDELVRWTGFSFPYRVLFNHDQSVALVPDFQKHYVRFFDAQTKQEMGTLKLEEKAGPQGIIMHPSENIAFLSLNLKNKIVAIDIRSQSVVAEYPTGTNPDGIVFIPKVYVPQVSN